MRCDVVRALGLIITYEFQAVLFTISHRNLFTLHLSQVMVNLKIGKVWCSVKTQIRTPRIFLCAHVKVLEASTAEIRKGYKTYKYNNRIHCCQKNIIQVFLDVKIVFKVVFKIGFSY